MKKIILFTILIFACMACRKNEEEAFPRELAPLQIAKGNLCEAGNIPKQNLVITTSAEWENLISAMNLCIEIDSEETAVDFSTHVVIAVFEEIKMNGGWSIDITNVVEYSNKIMVTVRNLQTGNLTGIIIQPFHIIKIPALGKVVEFNHI
jgi:hypothetical protein